MLKLADANNDGRLTKEELRHTLTPEIYNLVSPSLYKNATSAGISIYDIGSTMFYLLDTDNNSYVSVEEFADGFKTLANLLHVGDSLQLEKFTTNMKSNRSY